jgi:hypothetical protein
LAIRGFELLTLELLGYFARFTVEHQNWAFKTDVEFVQYMVLPVVWAAYSTALPVTDVGPGRPPART